MRAVTTLLLATLFAIVGADARAAPAPPASAEIAAVRARVARVLARNTAVIGTPTVRGALARVPYVLRDPQEAAGQSDGVNNGVALVVRYPFGWQVYRMVSAECFHPHHFLTPRDVRDCDTTLHDEGRPPDVSAIRAVMERSGALVVSSVQIVGAFGLANVGSFGVGGERSLARDASGWHEIGGGTVVISACALVSYGVPPPIATRLIDRAYWPDPAPRGARIAENCS